MAMKIGQSDFAMNGTIRNYISYILKDETLQGNLNMTSNLLNVNELMTLTGETPPAQPGAAEQPMEPVALPKNIDFSFNSTVGKMLYDNLTMDQLKGGITLKNGILSLKGLMFNTLDGSIKSDGFYSLASLQIPIETIPHGNSLITITNFYNKTICEQIANKSISITTHCFIKNAIAKKEQKTKLTRSDEKLTENELKSLLKDVCENNSLVFDTYYSYLKDHRYLLLSMLYSYNAIDLDTFNMLPQQLESKIT
jgi:hypothetical protein